MSVKVAIGKGTRIVLLFLSLLIVTPHATGVQAQETAIAIVGVTLIDGNGGAPLADATIVVMNKQIRAVGPRSAITVPPAPGSSMGAGSSRRPDSLTRTST